MVLFVGWHDKDQHHKDQHHDLKKQQMLDMGAMIDSRCCTAAIEHHFFCVDVNETFLLVLIEIPLARFQPDSTRIDKYNLSKPNSLYLLKVKFCKICWLFVNVFNHTTLSKPKSLFLK